MIGDILRDSLPRMAVGHLGVGVYFLACEKPGWAVASAIVALAMLGAHHLLTRPSDS